MARHKSVSNQTYASLRAQRRRQAWLVVLRKLGCFFIVALPSLLFPVALVTKVEDKQTIPVFALALFFSTVSLVLLSRLFKPTINAALSTYESPLQ